MVNDVVVPQFPLQNDEDLLDWKPVSGVKPHPVRLLVMNSLHYPRLKVWKIKFVLERQPADQ